MRTTGNYGKEEKMQEAVNEVEKWVNSWGFRFSINNTHVSQERKKDQK